MALGIECDRHGQAGDAKTYEPPNRWADDAQGVLNEPKPRHYDRLRPGISLSAPPPPEIVHQEIEYLRSLQKTVRAGLMPAIHMERDYFWQVFPKALGIPPFPIKPWEKTKGLLADVQDTAKFFIIKEKARVNRPRPVQLAPDLSPPFCPGHPAYPSGHAGESFAMALVLVEACDGYSRLHPAIMSAARNVAYHREVAGVHYPSDSEGGATLAMQLVKSLRGDDGYLAAVDEARRELRKLLGAP